MQADCSLLELCFEIEINNEGNGKKNKKYENSSFHSFSVNYLFTAAFYLLICVLRNRESHHDSSRM